jgi:hypothetical protein
MRISPKPSVFLMQSKDEDKRAKFAVAEIKHCRLAMLAFSGMVHQYFITQQVFLVLLVLFWLLCARGQKFLGSVPHGQVLVVCACWPLLFARLRQHEEKYQCTETPDDLFIILCFPGRDRAAQQFPPHQRLPRCDLLLDSWCLGLALKSLHSHKEILHSAQQSRFGCVV